MKFILMTLIFFAQTISEKRESLQDGSHGLGAASYRELQQVNSELQEARAELSALHKQAHHLFEQGADEEAFSSLLTQMQDLRREIAWTEEAWREVAAHQSTEDPYALWHQPWTSLEQVIIDYGSADHVYVIPPEVGGVRMSVTSNIPIPRESWDEMLTAILNSYGVGIRELSPFVRVLYLAATQPLSVTHITDQRKELLALSKEERVCFVLEPTAATSSLLERFSNPKTCAVHNIGERLFLFASVEEIQSLLRISDFMEEGAKSREFQLLTMDKISAEEMVTILELYFGETLKTLTFEENPKTLFLSASPEVLARAMKMSAHIESELEDPKELTVYTYTAKHSDPDELAATLSDVYNLCLSNGDKKGEIGSVRRNETEVTGNFVVYPKTGTIVMVVEQEFLPKLKTLLGRIDVPKKMVRIDVLFFEKKIEDQSRFGLDVLRLGSAANKGHDRVGSAFDGRDGILQFFVGSRRRGLIPAYDIAYNFLLAQEDIRINATPSITTLNSTPATIELVEEISIDTGTFVDPEFKDSVLRRSFSRQQYGITMTITPTVNTSLLNGGEEVNYITLETDVLFETPKPAKNDRPPVLRRHITNQVRIKDGETVILGGLRSKMSEDESASLPFIGEIPGIGKLFSSTKMRDRENEMFIFITPHIIDDPLLEMERVRQEHLSMRIGDTPEFIAKLKHARDTEKQALMARSIRALLGRDG